MEIWVSKTFQAFVRPKGTTEWKPVQHSGQAYYADEQGVGPLQQMTAMMAGTFRNNEYTIMEVVL
jgi:hypothetical protein